MRSVDMCLSGAAHVWVCVDEHVWVWNIMLDVFLFSFHA